MQIRFVLSPLLLVALALASVSASAAAPERALESGLRGEYYETDADLKTFPIIPDTQESVFSRIDKQINFPESDGKFAGTELQLHFFVRWTGVLRIPKDGKYTFYCASDDGARVFLDGELIVNNGVLHPFQESDSEELTLKAGDYPIKVEFYQFDGGAGCRLLWSGDGIKQEAIPESAFFHLPLPDKKKPETRR